METISISILRELFRNLIPFRNLYEDTGQDTILNDGVEYSLWDLERLYEALPLLPPRQAEAIELVYVRQMKEKAAAVAMGVSPTNPVCVYATDGLKNLVKLIEDGTLTWCRPSFVAA